MSGETTVTLDFRRAPPTARVFLMYIPAAIIGVGGCWLLIWPTYGTEYEDVGFLAACGLVLVVAALFVWWLYAAMTPMILEARPDVLVVINRKSGDAQQLNWDEVTYDFLDGGDREVMYLHVAGDQLVVKQHPSYLSSPPTYLEFRRALVERATQA